MAEDFSVLKTIPFYHLVKALRPHHWIKNLVVFAAPLFALKFEPTTFLLAAGAFLAFSFTASSFYLLNDIADIRADRLHPVKYKRPIAAGLVPIPVAILTAVVGLVASTIISYAIAPLLALAVGVYVTVQAGYNLGLKHKPIIDIMCISAGFVLRALGGAAATNVPVSSWFVLCVGLLAFYLGIEKRKAELKAVGRRAKKTRDVLQHYSLPWLHRMESVVASCTLMAYTLWTIEGAKTPWMLVTTSFVAYGIFKYQSLSEQGEGEAPEMILLSKPHILINVILWLITCMLILVFLS